MTTTAKIQRHFGVTRVVGVINEASLNEFRTMLDLAGPVDTLLVFIDSDGGSCEAASSIATAIRQHPARKVATRNIGKVFSSAIEIYLTGHERLVAPSAVFNIHLADLHGNQADPGAMAHSSRLVDLLAGHMTVARSTIQAWQERDTYFDVDDALRYGLATGLDTKSRERIRFDLRKCNRPQ